MQACVSAQRVQLSCNPIDCSPPGSSVHGVFPGKNTGVGCRFLLQGIFLTQRSNLGLLHWQAHSLPLSHMGSPVWPKTGHLISQSLKFSISKKWVQNLPHWIIKIKFCDVFITLSKHCTWSIVWWGLKKWCLLLYYFLEWKRFWVDFS